MDYAISTELSSHKTRHIPGNEAEEQLAGVIQSWKFSASSNDQPTVEDMSEVLTKIGFNPPGDDPAKWMMLARVIQVDPHGLTLRDLYDEARAFAERVRVVDRVRAGNRPPVDDDEPRRSAGAGRRFAFEGNLDWENWALGFEAPSKWHIYHFSRTCGMWKRHQHVVLRIPRGMAEDLAKTLVTNGGRMTLNDARGVWRKHSTGRSLLAKTMNATKVPMCRLRKAIVEAVRNEGHRIQGSPIVWSRKTKSWTSLMKVGTVSRSDRGGPFFSVRG